MNRQGSNWKPGDEIILPWEQPGWLDKIRSWIGTQLTANSLQASGPLEQFHIRPWSTVVRVPTRQGTVYFKASSPALAWEPALTLYLANSHSHLTPDILSTDVRRGWMLMRDSGTALRVSIRSEHSLRPWQDIMPLYAAMQKDLSPQVSAILALGVPDRRLDILPALFVDLLRDEDCLLIGQPEGLSPDEFRRLLGEFKAFELMCSNLAAVGIPATLHHDDFHDGNLFLQNGRVIFTDWGESAVTHPFFSLVVILRGAENSLNLPEDAPELVQMRDWFLEQWTEVAPLADLRQIATLAEKIGLVNRALTWHHVIQHIPAALKVQYACAVPAYLQDFLASLAKLS